MSTPAKQTLKIDNRSYPNWTTTWLPVPDSFDDFRVIKVAPNLCIVVQREKSRCWFCSIYSQNAFLGVLHKMVDTASYKWPKRAYLHRRLSIPLRPIVQVIVGGFYCLRVGLELSTFCQAHVSKLAPPRRQCLPHQRGGDVLGHFEHILPCTSNWK